MIITYETNENDVAEWNVFRIFNDPLQRRRLRTQRMMVAFLSAIIVLFFLIALIPNSIPFGIIAAPIISAFAAVFAYSARERTEKSEIAVKTRRSLRQGGMKIALGRREVSVRQNGIHIASGEFESLLKWSAIKKITKTEAHLFIYWSENEIFALPRRAFSDAAHEATFLQEIERHRQGLASAPLVVYAGPTLQAGITAPTTESNAPWWTSQTPLSPEKPTINVNTHNG